MPRMVPILTWPFSSFWSCQTQLYLHPWRWIAIAAPPMAAISDSAATYDDVPLTTVFRSVKSSRSALSGALVPLYLHPWRWIAIAAPPTATDSDSAATYGDALPALLLERAQPSRTALAGARATARSPPTAMPCDCSSTNGDDFGFCRHVWRRPCDGGAEVSGPPKRTTQGVCGVAGARRPWVGRRSALRGFGRQAALGGRSAVSVEVPDGGRR